MDEEPDLLKDAVAHSGKPLFRLIRGKLIGAELIGMGCSQILAPDFDTGSVNSGGKAGEHLTGNVIAKKVPN